MNNETIDKKIKPISPAQAFEDDRAYFTVSNYQEVDGELKLVPMIITSLKEYFPLENKSLKERGLIAITRPRPKQRWSEESIAEFIENSKTYPLEAAFEWIKEQFDNYIDFGDSRWAEVLSIWVIGTYVFQLFNSYPYIHLNGNMASGKTKTLGIIASLAFNAEQSTNSTPAYLIRMISDNSSTCCIDETESLQKAKDDDSKAVIGMYNSGYKKGGSIGKVEQNGKSKNWTPVEFNSYSPKIFAGINGLEDSLASRCISITMVRSSNSELKNREIRSDNYDLPLIREELYKVALDNFKFIGAIYNNITEETLTGRDWELWKPIFSIARLTDPEGGLFDRLRSFAIEKAREASEVVLDSFTAPKIIKAILTDFPADEERRFFSFSNIEQSLEKFDSDTFGWMIDGRHRRHLANELRKAGITKGQSVPQRMDGDVVKGFWVERATLEKLITAFE